MKITKNPTLAELNSIHEAIQPYIHRTPVLTSESINKISGTSLFFKCENFQKTGAFKMRGAASGILGLSESDRLKGIVTHSSGNHGQAVALASQLFGIKAFVVMPDNAAKIKQAAVKSYGANVILCKSTQAARQEMVLKVQKETGAMLIHPYDDFNVIAGQATSAKELIEDYPNLDIIITPVSGGGLLSGTALIAHYTNPPIEIWAGEPIGADDAYRSFISGKLQGNDHTSTIADGLRASLSQKTFDVIQKHVKGIIRVTDQEIIEAMRLIWERMKIIIEPSCAVPLAAILKSKAQFSGKRIGVILTGGNVDIGQLPF